MRNVMGFVLAAAIAAGCAGVPDRNPAAPGKIAIAVTEKGFEPATVTVKQGETVTLVVTRKTDKTCATEMMVPTHNIRRELPLHQPVEISLTPTKPGDLRFACGMDMVAGKIVVR